MDTLKDSHDDDMIEVNLDRVVGPTHHFGGLGVGNLASLSHAGRPSNPRAAAIQGIEKMRLAASLGSFQLVLPPQRRPVIALLRRLGFRGDDAELLRNAGEQSPAILSAVWSVSAMWTANAATVSAAGDCDDGRLHLSVANLTSSLHRSIESRETWAEMKRLLGGLGVAVHRPLPATSTLRDEGAANHMRLCGSERRRGLNVFVYGDDPPGENAVERDTAAESIQAKSGQRFAPRQSLAACQAIARLHRLSPRDTFFLRQSPDAIDAGVFHNDVVATACDNVLLYHARAFAGGEAAIDPVADRFNDLFGERLHRYRIDESQLSLEDTVSTYLFNSQLITPRSLGRQCGDGDAYAGGAMLCPVQVASHPGAARVVQALQGETSWTYRVRYVDLTQSMSNGGGPACLRLRLPLSRRQWGAIDPRLKVTDHLADRMMEIVDRTYPPSLTLADLAHPSAIAMARGATDELNRLIGWSEI